jgi:hypothetical protein
MFPAIFSRHMFPLFFPAICFLHLQVSVGYKTLLSPVGLLHQYSIQPCRMYFLSLIPLTVISTQR